MRKRLARVWDAFKDPEPPLGNYGPGYYRPPALMPMSVSASTITSAIFTRISLDVAALDFKHIGMNEEGIYLRDIDSGLNKCLNLSANIDQTGDDLLRNVVMTMLENGVAAVVPVVTSRKPKADRTYEIHELRVGTVQEWFPHKVAIQIWNPETALQETIILPKKVVSIIVNPFFHIMNEPNAMLKQLTSRLSVLNLIETSTDVNKFNMIVQMPNPLKNQKRHTEAQERVRILEDQLSKSRYGIGYIDATEKITLLNRAAENNLLDSIKYLTELVHGQLGMPESILNGTATEAERVAYHTTTIEPIAKAITDAFTRTFLTNKALHDYEAVKYFRDPFKYASIMQLAEISATFTSTEIMSSNEVRSVIGKKPSDDPRADMLLNKNINVAEEGGFIDEEITETPLFGVGDEI